MNEVKEESKYSRNIELLRRMRQGDERASEELVLLNTGLVNSIAARFIGRGVALEELQELGMLGLVKAMNSFDESRGCAFSTFAVPLIFGEIRRFLRDDGIIKVSRSSRRLGAILMAERERRQSRGENVGIEEIARGCGVSAAEAAVALECATPVASLSEPWGDSEGMTLEGIVCDEGECEREFDKLAVSLALDKLAPMQKKLIILRYFRAFSQQRTAECLGLTQVKVSREEKKILTLLQKYLS